SLLTGQSTEVCIRTAFHDITDLRQAQQEQEMASQLPEENPAPVIRLHAGRVLTYANPAAKAVLAEWGATLGGEAPAAIVQLARVVLASGEKRGFEMVFGHHAYLLQVVPIGPANCVNIYFTDLSERQRAERQLQVRDAISHVLAEGGTLKE